MKLKLLALFLFMGSVSLFAQDYFPKNDGVKAKKNNNYTAFTNAKIYVTPTQVINNGTLLIQNGKVVQVGKSVSIPKNTVVENLNGKSIYPSFIDVFSGFGIKLPKKANGGGRSAQYGPSREGFYWNDHIMPENDAINSFTYDEKEAKELRNAGFGTINAHIEDGIARGTGLLVALNDEASEAQRILSDKSAQYFSFEKSIASRQSYPGSLMGAMALMRQVYYDMDWYSKGNVDTKDRSLEALIANKGLTQIYAAGDNGNVLRADKIGDLFGIQYTILGGGDEYERIDQIKATNAKLILPLDFPDAFDVSNPYEAKYIALKDMRHWNLAPSNPKVLADNGVDFSITLHGLKSPKDLKEKIMKAITYGLSKTKALEALTTVPAQILGKSNEIGSLQAGSQANFLITSGDIFDKGTTLYENWVQGTKNVIESMDIIDIRGDYNLAVNGSTYKVSLTGDADKPKAEIKKGDETVDSKIDYSSDWLNISFSEDNVGSYRMVAHVLPDTKTITGSVVLPNGDETKATMTKTSSFEEKSKDKETDEKPQLMALTYPNVGYGFKKKPEQENILFKNATVWTGESILENTDVLIKNGKISKVGKDLRAGGATLVDATGKHLTAGIIDEHTHIAALSINEGGHNSSAEVRMEDVIDPKDVAIYRDLAGGVTTAQLLHGSANPIGGQSAIFRLKWGESAEDMVFDNSPKFIKFALGENVKQSNWGSYSRFPQTRMGVEQVYTDYFQRAKEYDEKKKSGEPYRHDEEMETLAEILNGERFISCHSYVQSEINMMMKVAEKFGFRVNTFTHILEGYKVADKMAEHGVGGGTFSDWWAYKYEVNDAIPYNAAIMSSQGVTVAINSDDAEMSRRLNQEAAKTVKYGGMSEIEAWKTVTLNPAKLLHLDDRVGSIEEGKDADVVLWSDHPLSVYAKAEKTLIEGKVYFDLEKDKKLRESIKKERNQLIGMMLNENKKGEKSRTPVQSKKEEFNCDTL
ncbi:amidohydrolase family protein [Flagellimonas halotolerans]|uniref:Amidohydrolase family protein n=1 Tax=Flagellimonas halotolerans TaxID=3112164 RepID=A0ABU6IR57_9FLAO|nr:MULTISPECIES: amidohydrolase family protein [unclassified Allomuricauda]MEC3965534.1 amidohydrolase family protein [Muricauda sp. SYSU M86414]MEC4265400.1 amidohydrolase family protein [Muricauda sp. SYSU M84420]